jgi:hypothetical protein
MKKKLLLKKAVAMTCFLFVGNLSFAQLSGNINVGAGQTYTTLTGTAGLFNAINTNGMNGDLTATITSDLTEDGSVGLSDFTTAGINNYHLNIVTDAATVKSITNTGNLVDLLKFTAVRNLKIDGSFNGSGQYLRFSNNYVATTPYTIRFVGTATAGCLNDTIKNCIIEGANSSTAITGGGAVIGLDASGTAMGANNIAIQNNLISSPGTYNGTASGTIMAGSGVKSLTGTSASASNSNILIDGNNFANCQWTGIVQSTSTTGTASPDHFTITNNSFYYTVASAGFATLRYMVYVRNGQNHIVSNNWFGGTAAQATGTPLTFSSSNNGAINNIYLAATATGNVEISGNTIANFSYATSSTGSVFYGVYATSGSKSNITGNTIRNISLTGSGYIYGVYNLASNTNVSNNIIGGDYAGNKLMTGGVTAVGIYASGSNDTISGNTIRNMVATGTNSTGTSAVGIFNMGVAPYIYNNTIDSIIGNNSGNSGLQAVMGINVYGNATGSFLVAKNKITNVINTNTTGTAYTSTVLGIGIINNNSTSTMGGRLDGNYITNVYGLNTANGNNICGILENNNATTGGNDTFTNNVVIFDKADTAKIWLKCIHIANGAVTHTFVNNTFYISENVSFNANLSSNKGGASCLSRLNGNPNLRLYNNIFINKATNAGTGYVTVFNLMANSTGIINSNYNLFYNNNASNLSYIAGTATDFNSWKTTFAADTNSMTGLVPFISNTDMHIITSMPGAWNAYGSGMAFANAPLIQTDIDGNTRSTTPGIPTTLGAYEIAIPTVVPAAMTMTPVVPTIGTPTVFSSNGRKVAEINWGATATLPSAISGTFYPGIPVPGSPNASNVRSYFDIQQTGFAGNYTIKLYTNNAESNNIAYTAMGAIKKHDGDANFTTIANTGSNNIDASGNYVLSNTLTNFSIFGLTDPSVPLPVTWNNVSAMLNRQKQAVINWSVSEKEIAEYLVQKSTDGVKFENIATVNSKGNGNNTYGYAEVTALKGKAWYRIVQVDKDGKEDYSRIMELQNSSIYGRISIYPNPATQILTVETEAVAAYSIYDLQGKVVLKGNLQSGKNILNISGIAKGFYTIKIGDYNQKIVLQ